MSVSGQNCETCQDWRRACARPAAGTLPPATNLGECWSADRLDGDLTKGPAAQTYNFERCEAHRPHEPLSPKLAAIYAATHRDYKGMHNGEPAILVLRDAGTSLVLLRNLTDAEIERRTPRRAS